MFLFPSPIGELHFSMIMARGKKLSRIRVSVPYRGATFLNDPAKQLKKAGTTGFPSPIGELHFSIRLRFY